MKTPKFQITPADVIRLRLMGVDPGVDPGGEITPDDVTSAMREPGNVDPEVQVLLDELAWDLQMLDAKAEHWYSAWKWTFGALMFVVIIGILGWLL